MFHRITDGILIIDLAFSNARSCVVNQMGTERNYNEDRRTYPGYLTHSEYEKQRSQLDEMVKGITKVNPIEKKRITLVEPIEKVGETANFCIEIDREQRTVLLKERNVTVQCPFKLSIEPDEVEDIMELLTKGVGILRRRH